MVTWSDERVGDMKRFQDLRAIPKDVLTKDVAISICEDIIDHFNIPYIRRTQFWREKDGKNQSYYTGFGWYTLIGTLLQETSVKRDGITTHFHPDAWSIIQSKLSNYI